MRAATVAAAAFALGSAAWAAWSQGWTYDERVHLAWTERMVDSGVTERLTVGRYNTKTPVVLPNVLLRKAARAAGVQAEPQLRFAARLPSLAWVALVLGGVFFLARAAFGSTAAHLAAIATALDPNIVAHGSLATVDAAFTATVAATVVGAIAFARAPSLPRAAGLGFAFGMALVAKFSALLLVPAFALAPLFVRAPLPPARRVLTFALAAASVAWLTVSSWYLFLDVGRPLGGIAFRSPAMQAIAARLPGLPAPVPAAFLTGVDGSLADEREEWGSVILGRRYPAGVWFYFAFLWLVKTPLLVLAAQAVGYAAAARKMAAEPAARLLAWLLAFHLAWFSLVFRAHIGYRFVLMLVPLGYALAAGGLARLGPSLRTRRALAVVGLVAAAENAAYIGNPLAFTNAAVQPKRLAFRLVADSNIDWGQDRERIAGTIARAGAGHTILEPLHVLPGHITLGLNEVAGVFDFERHRWLRENLDPGGHFRHTYLWFQIDAPTYDRFLDATRRLRPEPWAEGACPADTPFDHHPPGSRLRLALDTPPRAGDGFVACVETRRGVDFGLRVVKGLVRFGRLAGDGGCAADTMAAGQVSWYRLDPGRHALCLVELPNRRAWLPYAVEGTWLVRGRAASLGLRRRSFSAPGPPPPGSTSPRSSSPPPPPAG